MSCMFVPNLEEISHMLSVLGTENRPKSLAQKAVSAKNGQSSAKIFHMVMSKDTVLSLSTHFWPQ